MYLRVAQAAALAFNLLGTLTPVAAAAQLWSGERALAWVSFAVFAVILLFGHSVPILGIVGMLVGWGLLAYAATGEATAAVIAAIAAALMYYLIAWQVHRAKQIAGSGRGSASS